ncbi:hypothetical protein R84B8_01634 [Treponema sp. R8-4-B8]
MVKSASKILLILSLVIIGLTIECNIDMPGLIVSNYLDERLLEKNTFNYLTAEKRNVIIKVRDPSDPNWNTSDRPPENPDPNDPSALAQTDPYKYSFIIIADTHVEGSIEDLKKIKPAIKGDVKFLANLGDISQYGAEDDIKDVMEFYDTLDVPCYPVIGNHDIYSHNGLFNWNWPVWKDNIGSTRYRVNGEIDTYRLVNNGSGDEENIVHTEYFTLFVLDSANAFIGKVQIDWLERELKTAKGTVFVLTHSDFFVQDKIKIQQIYDPAERARIMALLHDNNDKCKMLLTGHSHERVEKEFGDVKYISIEDYKSTQAYMIITVGKDGVRYEFKDANKL